MQADEIETQVKPSNVGTWRLLGIKYLQIKQL